MIYVDIQVFMEHDKPIHCGFIITVYEYYDTYRTVKCVHLYCRYSNNCQLCSTGTGSACTVYLF